MNSLVSVIIPVYNGEKFIYDAVDSVLKQDYSAIEIIVIDDGSTDKTRKIVEGFKDKVRYYYKENGGEASARNYGLKVSEGEYISFLDCDDLLKIDKISKQVNALKNNKNFGFVYNDVDVIDHNNYIKYTLKSEEEFYKREDKLAYLLFRQLIPATASIMVRKNCLDRNIYYTEEYSNSVDYFFTIRLLQKVNGLYLKESLYLYRRHEGNLTNNHKEQKRCEKDIIKGLGINTINDIVEKSSFSTMYKTLLLSKIYLKIGELELACKKLEEIAYKERGFQYFFQKGVCEYALNMYDVAVKSFEKAIEIDNNKAEAYNNLGCCYKQIDKVNNARDCFRHASLLNNGYLDAKENLHCILSGNNKLKFTERCLRKTLSQY